MKLRASTPAGIGLGIDVLLTGRVRESSSTIVDVEIYMPIGARRIIDHHIEPLPLGRGSSEILRVGLRDLCTNDGAPVSEEEIRTEVARVLESLRYEDTYGPLGKDWP